jgi:hypothetical protein
MKLEVSTIANVSADILKGAKHNLSSDLQICAHKFNFHAFVQRRQVQKLTFQKYKN